MIKRSDEMGRSKLRRPCGHDCDNDFCGGFVVCNNKDGTWEVVCGEDTMQCRVGEIMEQTGLGSDEIFVFRVEDEIDNEQ